MATPAPPPHSRPVGRWIAIGAGTAALALVTTLAVVWPGFDAQQTPLEDASVWALQSGDGRRYAKVNTQLGELETVKQVENPSGIAQNGDSLLVYADGDSKVAQVNLATPVDLDADAVDAFESTPSGTREVSTSGDYLAYLTDSGDVYTGRVSAQGATVAVDPFADTKVEEGQERPRLRADAVAVTSDGTVFAASAARGSVVTADAATGDIRAQQNLGSDTDAALQITAVGRTWVALDPDDGMLWTADRSDPIPVQVDAAAVLQRPTGSADAAYIADSAGLVRVALDGSGSQRVVDATGTAAAPTEVGGTLVAAWLGTAGGTLWSATDGPSELDYGGRELGDQVTPDIAVNGGRGILNETSSGWVWTMPDGRLVASSQEWDSDQKTQQTQDQQIQAERVVDPRPPIAVPDAFGVRAGREVVLPVLLNDHDANEDVLTVRTGSVTGLDPAFGTVRATDRDQQLVVNVAPGAVGSATFTYQATDGTSADGLNSAAATVTLTVVPENVNNAPVWCGVDGCLATWPTPQVVPGGTTSVDVLGAWVDPDGDPIYLARADNQTGIGTVAADPGGTVTYQHPDPNATDAVNVQLALTVSDSRGASAERTLTVAVTPSPQLTVDSFAVTGTAGTPLAVELRPHLHGANGAVSLTSAQPLNEGGSSAVANQAALSFTFTASAAGSYVVQYTVRDQATEATGIARVTMLDPATAQISSPPLVAFVRPNEDASVDVVAAVDNPAGVVLMVSDLRPEPEATASLSADTVGQNLIRVTGTTDTGQPGSLGTVRYTVSDGSGNATATTTGELTVILLPSPTAEPPIAVDDAITVRAGTQIDVPVLDNDTAPAGALIAVDPSKVVNESGAGLAFGTPRAVRYLAPPEAGNYSLSYTIYRIGFPEMTDSARVHVTVLAADSNNAPVPVDLVGRVLSGASVSIPFDGFAIDPDGDTVTLDRVLTQPTKGSAAISADGTALVYTSAPASSGQDSFTYRVRDALGATGTATVRIGILDATSDPRPVTYSDYAQAQAGTDNEVDIHPADNDVDPAGSKLDLIEVRPNAQSGSAEYNALETMLTRVDTDTGSVRVKAGTELGTYSFVYTVRNRTGDTAQGLIVLKVVRNPVPDYPVVTDTLLTAESRERLPGGIDVVDGKVAWTAGDVSSLKLSLWDTSSNLKVDGWRISGPLPEKTTLVPFEVRGTSFNGTEVVSYGFLRIPGDDDIALTLRASFPQVTVNEKSAVDIDMSKAVAVPNGQTLQVGTEGLVTSGARGGATCTLAGGTTVHYDAGAGAPWTDVCTVPVKLATQEDYTFLAVRITIIADAPQPELRAASVSISPGSQTTYDLATMTTWAGQADWSALQYAAGYTGDQFDVVQQGSLLTVTARDASRPGREEPVVVRLTSHPDIAAATLTLTVGPAPSTLPKGGTASQQCSQSGGNTSCTITVIGGGGEINPLPGTPLSLVSVSGPSNCPGVSFSRASDQAVTASWAADAPGAGNCTGSFVVQDAQQRQSSGDRDGTIILDLQGLPANPARVNWTGYDGANVTLAVVSEATSYPAVTGYRVTGSDGRETTCSADGICNPIASSPATGGQGTTYQAKALNGVGESRGAVSVMAWSYQPPQAPSAVTAVPTGDLTSRISVTVNDPSTGSLSLRIGGNTLDTRQVGGAGRVDFDVNVGTNVGGTIVTAVPSTRYTVPPASVAGGSSEGQTTDVEAWGIGAPPLGLSFEDSDISGFTGKVTVTAHVASPNAKGATLLVGFSRSGENCTPNKPIGDVTGTARSDPFTVGIQRQITYGACAVYVYNGQQFARTDVSDSHRLTGNIPAPSGNANYTITLGGADGDTSRTATLTSPPALTISNTSDYEILYFAGGGGAERDVVSLIQNLTSDTRIVARTCLREDSSQCSSETTLQPTGAVYPVKVTFAAECGADPIVINPNTGSSVGGWSYTKPTHAAPTGIVKFNGPLSALGTTSRAYDNCEAPPPPPPPPPTPTSGPTSPTSP